MKDYLEYLDRKLIFKLLKGLAFIMPIVLITNRCYLKKYGTYDLKLDWQNLFEFVSKHPNRCVYTLIIFACIFLAAYFSEKILFPILSRFINPYPKKNRRQIFYLANIKLNSLFKSRFNVNFSKEMQSLTNEDVINFFESFSFIPVVAILWMLVVNTTLSYISIIVIISIFIFLSRAFNGVFIEYLSNKQLSDVNEGDKEN